MPDSRDVITVERVIPAPPQAIFALLADPARHPDIDGSGTVQGLKGDAGRLTLGSTFGMSMKMGIPYSMASTVVEFEEDRRIAWQTRGPGSIGRHFGGRIWRYELDPVDGGTRVRETWDLTHEAAAFRPLARMAGTKTATGMTATLERIEALLA